MGVSIVRRVGKLRWSPLPWLWDCWRHSLGWIRRSLFPQCRSDWKAGSPTWLGRIPSSRMNIPKRSERPPTVSGFRKTKLVPAPSWLRTTMLGRNGGAERLWRGGKFLTESSRGWWLIGATWTFFWTPSSVTCPELAEWYTGFRDVRRGRIRSTCWPLFSSRTLRGHGSPNTDSPLSPTQGPRSLASKTSSFLLRRYNPSNQHIFRYAVRVSIVT